MMEETLHVLHSRDKVASNDGSNMVYVQAPRHYVGASPQSGSQDNR